MTERKLLKGKVASILGDYELAINLGKNAGVKLGMEFAVIGEKLITDPDSGKSLGSYKYDKVKVEVKQVEDKFSIASTMPTSSLGIPMLDLGLTISHPKLRSDIALGLEEFDRNVSSGDVVEERR